MLSRKDGSGLKRKRRGVKVLIVFLMMIISACVFLYAQLNWIQVTNYDITDAKIPGAFDGYKILQLSDLHSKEFGENNKGLIRKIDQLAPDVIFITGDMFNSFNDNGEVFIRLAEDLVKKYYVYYILGNHEQIASFIGKNAGDDWVQGFLNKLSSMGIRIADNKKTFLERNGERISLYGLDVPLMYYRAHDVPYGKDEKHFTDKTVRGVLSKAEEEAYNILLVHTPDYFSEYALWGADLIFTGHIHGGIVRVPFKGGLLSPEQYYWPRYYAGMYSKGDSKMIVNRGLGVSASVPIRIFNRPEISVVTLHSGVK